MGIHNLLPFVKKACRQGHISEFAGQSVAVDVSCLLHRGMIGCADRLSQGLKTDFYVHYVMKYVKALLANECHVILVFDGQPLPAKKAVNNFRREMRDFNKHRGDLLLSEGKRNEAYDHFKRSASLTAEVIENTIQAFRNMNMVDILVAPYESDAQLAFLTKSKMALSVVTEDSDLIAFGCDKILFKMDPSGSCVVYEQENLPKCLCRALADNFDFEKFRRICILAGCDYLQEGLPGIGLNKAATFFAKASGNDMYQVLPRLPRYLNMTTLKVKKEFIADFIRAENTFLYQIVYDPSEKRQRPLNDYPPITDSVSEKKDGDSGSSQTSEDDFSYAGEIKPPRLAERMALGNRCDESRPDGFQLPEIIPEWSIWNANYKCRKISKDENSPKEKNETTNCGAVVLTASENSTEKLEKCDDENVKSSLPSLQVPINVCESRETVRDRTSTHEQKEKNLRLCRSNRLDENVKSNGMLPRISMHRMRLPEAVKKCNGLRSNWNCDRLLKQYKESVPDEASNPAMKLFCGDEAPLKKARGNTSEFETVESANTNRSCELRSKYFLNKGAKTSGLLRASSSSSTL